MALFRLQSLSLLFTLLLSSCWSFISPSRWLSHLANVRVRGTLQQEHSHLQSSVTSTPPSSSLFSPSPSSTPSISQDKEKSAPLRRSDRLFSNAALVNQYETKDAGVKSKDGNDQKNETPTSTIAPPLSSVNLTERTLECLDFEVILDAVRSKTTTIAGLDLVTHHCSNDAKIINKRYRMVQEMKYIMHDVPIRSSLDVSRVLQAIEFNMASPEPSEWAEFAAYIEEMAEIHQFFKEYVYPPHNPSNAAMKVTSSVAVMRQALFASLTKDMKLPSEVVDTFSNAFDEEGRLNADKVR